MRMLWSETRTTRPVKHTAMRQCGTGVACGTPHTITTYCTHVPIMYGTHVPMCVCHSVRLRQYKDCRGRWTGTVAPTASFWTKWMAHSTAATARVALQRSCEWHRPMALPITVRHAQETTCRALRRLCWCGVCTWDVQEQPVIGWRDARAVNVDVGGGGGDRGVPSHTHTPTPAIQSPPRQVTQTPPPPRPAADVP